jgi:16S rRNA (guanine527-N7)-methyltransferase
MTPAQNPTSEVQLGGANATEFAQALGVSRETCRRLERYVQLLAKWNSRINLVSQTTISAGWARHLLDSAQLLPFVPAEAKTWLDLGSGAGLPGLPVAIVATELHPRLRVTLVEADRRKVAFLQTVIADLKLDVSIEASRIETLPPRPYNVISARALASLDRLCDLAYPFSNSTTVFLFPKGAKLDSELTKAARRWHIHVERVPSRTHPDSTILRITKLEPRA